jgi:hypothetical protein
MNHDLDAIRKKIDQLSGKRTYQSNVKLWKPKEGDNKIRIIPWPTTTDGTLFHERKIYYTADKRIVSPEAWGLADPIAEFIGKLYDDARSGNEESREIAKLLRPAVTTCIAVVDRDAEDEGVQLWALAKPAIVMDLYKMYIDQDIQNFMDPKTGTDIKVEYLPTKKMYNNKPVFELKVTAARKSSVLHADDAVAQKWLSSTPDIDSYFKKESYESIKERFEQWLNTGGMEKLTVEARNAITKKELEKKLTEKGDDSKGDDFAASLETLKEKESPPAKKSAQKAKVEKTEVDELDDMLRDLEGH